MIERSSNEVFQTMERRSAMGFVMDVLATTGSIERKEKNVLMIKEKLLIIPEGMIEKEVLCKHLEDVLLYEETIMVIFKKHKHNGKVGHKKEFSKGFYYYIGTDQKNLTKVYAHWKEDKQFLLQNIFSLSGQSFWVTKYIIDCIDNVVCINFSLSHPDNQESKAEVSVYIGYNA